MAYGNVAVQQKKDVFAEAIRDPSIIGLGVSLEAGVRPPTLVKRDEFPSRAGKEVVITETILRQTTYKTKSVTLIRPVLKAEAAMWRFEGSDGDEFSAKMKDPDYIEVLKSKTTGIPLAIGIEMIIEFEYKQEKIDGVWHNTEVSVRRVLSPKAGPTD